MILDTCAVLWLAFDQEKLSDQTLERIERADIIRICTLSFWEIGVKVKKKKLEMPIGVNDLAQRFSRNESVQIVAPDITIITLALDLDWQHKDLVDRMIVAMAKKFDDIIVTADSEICTYYPQTIR